MRIPTNTVQGMPSGYPGPFYSYTTGYSPAEIRDALDDIDDFIQENGPFDGIIAFSQGGGLAASYILDYQSRNPNNPPPFQFAVLLSPAAAFSADEACCFPIIDELLGKDYESVKTFPDVEFTQISPKGRLFTEYLALTFGIGIELNAIQGSIKLFEDRKSESIPRILHPSVTARRIGIPVVHYTGKLDWEEMNAQSQIVRRLCDESMTLVHEHAGGHSVPSKRADVKALVSSIEWAIGEGAQRGALQQALKGISNIAVSDRPICVD